MQGGLAPGSVFAGDFEIVEPLAEGGMGALYVARQRSTGALRALKLMQRDLVRSPALREKFEQEARIGARIESDHVAQVLAAGVDAASGMPWIAMELLRGETLAAYAERVGPLQAPHVVAIYQQICHALGAAHRQSIVHRDLKPENIFLATPRAVGVELMVKLLDFGIAKVVAEATSSQTGAMGTPMYMAPEQYQGRGIGPWTDVWALGLIAFYLLTGKSYWRSVGGTTSAPAALMYEVCMEPIVPASARATELGVTLLLPEGFDRWFARCVARETADRFSDAGEVLQGMRAMMGDAVVPVDALPPRASTAGTVPLGPMSFSPANGTVPVAPPTGGWGGGGGGQGTVPAIEEDGPPRPKLPRAKKTRGNTAVPSLDPATKSAARDRSGKLIMAGLGVLAIGALGFAVWASSARTTSGVDAGAELAASATWSDEASPVPVSFRDPVEGSRAAPVTLVVFSDFQCPFCYQLVATVTELEARYGTDKLRVVWKNNPLPSHHEARPAAIAGEAVFRLGGSPAFWRFHDLAFANQKELAADKFEAWAVEAGVDRASFRAKLEDPDVAAKVDADVAAGKTAGASRTPATFINGVLLIGAQPSENFTAIIDAQLQAASAAIAAGTPADGVYVALSTKNKKNEPSDAAETDDKVYVLPIGDSPVRGSPSARVTIVEISEFQCPFCSRVQPTLDQVRETYGDKVRFVWKNNPLAFHKRAEPAAELALEAAAQGNFWQAHDLLFKNQTHLEDTDLDGYARSLGLDVARVRTAITRKKYAAKIAADQHLAAEVGANGTPTFFINGRKLVGAQPFEKFKTAIDRALAERP